MKTLVSTIRCQAHELQHMIEELYVPYQAQDEYRQQYEAAVQEERITNQVDHPRD